MEVILLEKVQNLGNVGDRVRVRNGYGRNFLVPYGKAVSATESNVAKFEAQRAELEKRAASILAEAQARKAKLDGFKVTLASRAGDEGKLFGSIGVRDVAQAVTDAGIALEKQEVHMPEGPLRFVGEFDIE
ncbi:MAG: 50S ribosomal protein L9, partial [Gammaproteobacteria bacterium]|nr:50S ribosomal protein L9 [Gammaproteobacteria bacterium]